MNAFIYNAALYCEPCGLEHVASCKAANVENNGDSDAFPQGPYNDGGGEADTPKHCDACGVFLENPLTPDGYAYVKQAINEWRHGYGGNANVLAQWNAFYLNDQG